MDVFVTYLEVRPVGGHAGPVGVFPPAEVLMLIDGHQCVVELIIHGPHTKWVAGDKRDKQYRPVIHRQIYLQLIFHLLSYPIFHTVLLFTIQPLAQLLSALTYKLRTELSAKFKLQNLYLNRHYRLFQCFNFNYDFNRFRMCWQKPATLAHCSFKTNGLTLLNTKRNCFILTLNILTGQTHVIWAKWQNKGFTFLLSV